MTVPPLRRLAGLALTAGLAACASSRVPDAVEDPRTPTEQFAAKVVTQPQEVRLAVHAQGLSPNQAGALAVFADDWREAGGGVIRIQAPSAGPDAGASYRTGEGARALLVSRGVPEDQIEVVGYDAKGAADAPLLVGFLRHQVDIPACGQKWTNFAHTAMNKPQPNFGCAVTANMAAQIANPADLLGPRPAEPADAQRRMTVLEKYRAGETTSSAKDDNANGAVSQTIR